MQSKNNKQEDPSRVGPNAEDFGLSVYWDRRDDATFTCPYDPSHKIRRFRMERHLTLCKKNNPGVKVVTCPYNASHVLPANLYIEHVIGCPDIRLVDPDQGMVRSEGAARARIFQMSIGSSQVTSDASKSLKDFTPVGRLACLKSVDEEDSEPYDDLEVAGGNFQSPNEPPLLQGPSAPRKFQDQRSLKEEMRLNFLNFGDRGKGFVESNVIAGGAPAEQSLYSCGGVAPPTPAEQLVEVNENESECDVPLDGMMIRRHETSISGEAVPVQSFTAPPHKTMSNRERQAALAAAMARYQVIRDRNSASADSSRTF